MDWVVLQLAEKLIHLNGAQEFQKARQAKRGVNFSVYSQSTTGIQLLLFQSRGRRRSRLHN